MNFAITIIDKIRDNSGTVTVTGNSIGTVVESTKRGGFSNEEKRYSITGSATSGVATVIGRIKIEALENYFFNKTPYLNFSNNVKLSRKNVSDSIRKNDNKNIITYNFDIIYINTVATYKSDNLVLNLNYNSIVNSIVNYDITSTVKYINNIQFGKRILSTSGETRKIRIRGDEGAVFQIAVVEATEERDAGGNIKNINEISILKNPTSSPTVDFINQYGNSVSVLEKTIDSTGMFSFNQIFPNNIVVNGKLNGSMAGDKNMDLDSARGILKGDEILMTKINKKRNNSTKARDVVGTLSTATRVLTNNNITAADNTLVQFARPKAYYIYIRRVGDTKLNNNMSSAYDHPYGQDISEVQYVYRLTQPLDPILSITTTSSSDYTINGVTAGTAYTSYYRGKPNNSRIKIMSGDHNNTFTLSYALVRSSGAFAIVGASAGEKYPVFSKDGIGSAWTNSLLGVGGGYDVDIFNIQTVLSTTSSSNDTATITLRFSITKWGNEDIDMVMDLTKFVKTA